MENDQNLALYNDDSKGTIVQATNSESANEVFKALQKKESRFAVYKKRVIGSKFLGNILQSASIIEQNRLIDNECDVIINQISNRTGIEFSAIADTILVEDFSFVDDKGSLNSSFSSSNNDDMKYLFASCLTRLSSIIKRQIAGRPLSDRVITVNDIMWADYKDFKTNEVTRGSDVFASFLPEDIRKSF